MEAEEVRLPQQRRGVRVRRVELALRGGIDSDGVVIEHAHIESGGSTGHGPADAAEAHHTECLAVDIDAPEQVPLPTLPLPGPSELVGLHDATGGGHEQGPGEVCRRLGQHVGRVGHDDAVAARSGHVDVVVAHGHVRDDLERGDGRQHFLVDRADDVADQTILALEPGDQLLLCERIVRVVQIDPHIGREKLDGFSRQRVGDKDVFGHCSPWTFHLLESRSSRILALALREC